MPTMISLNRIVKSDQFQVRDSLNHQIIERMTEAMQADNASFPPLTVWQGEGGIYLLDGFHRINVYETLGRKSAQVEFFVGTSTQALEHAINCNMAHGVTMTPADIKRSVKMMIARVIGDGGVVNASDLARRFGLSPSTVSRWIKAMEEDNVLPTDPIAQAEMTNTDLLDDEEDDDDEDLGADLEDISPSRVAEPTSLEREALEPAARHLQVTAHKSFFAQTLSTLQTVRTRIESEIETEYGAVLAREQQRFDKLYREMRELIRAASPACVCPACNGKGCKICGGKGWLSVDEQESRG